eukprot:Nitzschia sp. Nitz4//scaffold46_size129759//65471//67300//NITZ4_003505-RA/size129759-processed-gene-0.139-mRNA-1//1//CDS//3329552607//3821//frame0
MPVVQSFSIFTTAAKAPWLGKLRGSSWLATPRIASTSRWILRNQPLRCLSSTSQQLQQSSSSLSYQDFVKDKKVRISYITDIEGDKAYLDRYVNISKVLTFVDNNNSTTATPWNVPYPQVIDFTDPHAMLVFGGDVWDKGGYDLYSIRQLLHLKARYPHRVLFILGNRDLNKLRLLQELGLHDPPPKHPGLKWFRGTGRVGDPDGKLPSEDSVERLQWMLAYTMGSPNAFQYRKEELEWERTLQNSTRTQDEGVSDHDVVESYRSACHPQGEMGQFLTQGHLVARLGPLLFLHGALPITARFVTDYASGEASVWDDLTFCMPWMLPNETAKDHGVCTMEDWMEALNGFLQDRMQNYHESIAEMETRVDTNNNNDDDDLEAAKQAIWAYRGGYHNGTRYSDLVQYGMGRIPGGPTNPTVVYNSFAPDGMPHRFFPNSPEPEKLKATQEFFARTGISWLLAGHKPQGDLPCPIRVNNSSWILLADTSYSSDTIWWNKDDEPPRENTGRGQVKSFRGDCTVSEVLVELENDQVTNVMYHGVLSDATPYESANLLDAAKHTGVGQMAPADLVPSEEESPHNGKWWWKSVLKDGTRIFHAGEDFSVWNYMTKKP